MKAAIRSWLFQSQRNIQRVKRHILPIKMPQRQYHPLTLQRMKLNPTVEDLETSCEKCLSHCQSVLDELGKIPSNNVTVDNFFKPLLDQKLELLTQRGYAELACFVCTGEVQSTGTKLLAKIETAAVEFETRKDIFDNLLAVEALPEAKNLSREKSKALEYLINEGRRDGLQLTSDLQAKVKSLLKELSALSNEFLQNYNEENSCLYFTSQELAGMDDQFLANLEKTDDGKYKVTMKYPHVRPIMQKCRVAETRKALNTKFNARCMESNTKVLERMIELRHKKAQILGYPTHAAFILEKNMAETPETVSSFLRDLAERLSPLLKAEIAVMLRYKKEECEKYGWEFDGLINAWDTSYYMNLIEKHDYAVDHTKLQNYFPMDVVTKGLFHIYQELLGVVFTHVEDAELWHTDALMYEVTDVQTGDLLGHLYMDLYPRDGKFSHACCQSVERGCKWSDGTKIYPSCNLICNFTKPTANQQSLLTHDEVTTYFHEFGHAMHNIFSNTETSLFSNILVQTDFLEAPSQMLENWCWKFETLRLMSAHHETKEKVPEHDVKTLINSRTANAGYIYTRQIFFALFDQAVHTSEKVDTASLFAEMSERLLGIKPAEGTNMPASFFHLVKQYDAQYYSYMWSEVFSIDMFASRFEKEGLMNKMTGADYKKHILQPGGSLGGNELLRNFLGRDANPQAFLKYLGINDNITSNG